MAQGVAALAPMAAPRGIRAGCEAPQGPQNHPIAGQGCGVSTNMGSVGLRVWTLAGPAAWQRQALAAQPWSEFFHFSPRLASLEQTWPQPPLAPGTRAAQILIWSLENTMERRVGWAVVYRIAKSQTQPKQLSLHAGY